MTERKPAKAVKTAGSISHERYTEFDAKWRQVEALEAGAEDIKELEAVEKRGYKGGKNAS
jgi:hypothetical protein